MPLAVLLYRDTANPDQVPGDWPAETRTVANAGEVEVPWVYMTEVEFETYISNPELLAQKELWNLRSANAEFPVTLLIDTLTADEPAAEIGVGEVTCMEGTKIFCNGRLVFTDTEILVPLDRVFRTPVVSKNGEDLISVQVSQGVVTATYAATRSGVWVLSQEILNRELEAAERIKFSGLKIYVLQRLD